MNRPWYSLLLKVLNTLSLSSDVFNTTVASDPPLSVFYLLIQISLLKTSKSFKKLKILDFLILNGNPLKLTALLYYSLVKLTYLSADLELNFSYRNSISDPFTSN